VRDRGQIDAEGLGERAVRGQDLPAPQAAPLDVGRKRFENAQVERSGAVLKL
jgi:hypothetical protein